jgi:hypothetical protein
MRTHLAVALCLFTGLAHAQVTLERVKISGEFHWGEGQSPDRQQAIDLARQDLVQKMVVTITSEQDLQITDDGVSNNSRFELRTRSLSRLQLRGLDHIVTERNQIYRATAYIGKQEFEQGIAEVRTRILTQLEQMTASKNKGDTSSAIQQAFDILVQTYFVPVPVITEDSDSGRKVDVQSFVRNELTFWLRDAEVSVDRVVNKSAPGHVELNLATRVRFGSEQANHVIVQFNRPGYGEHDVRNGSADVFMDVEPEQPTQNVEMNLFPAVPGSFDAEMKQLGEQIRPVRVVSVPVSFKDVIGIDFRAERLLGTGFRFTPQFTNLSVFDLQWDFGNGETSTANTPRVDMPDIGPMGRPITLTVNRSPELVVKKVLHADGQLRAPVAPVVTRDVVAVRAPDPVAPAPRTDAVVAVDLVPLSHRNFLDPMLRIRNANELNEHLDGLRRQNRVRVGRSADVGPADQAYIAIVDPENREVKTILSPVYNGVRYEFSTNSAVPTDQLRTRYSGMGSVWFSFR